jgi:hypothetical protein
VCRFSFGYGRDIIVRKRYINTRNEIKKKKSSVFVMWTPSDKPSV